MSRFAVLVITEVALSPGVVAAQPAPRTISVNGTAEVRVAPNEFVLTVGVGGRTRRTGGRG
jgi:hypothetical protein